MSDNDPTLPKPFKSLAQARRCDGLVSQGALAAVIFERDLLATDLAALPWRVGPDKPGDPTAEGQEEVRQALLVRQAALAPERP